MGNVDVAVQRGRSPVVRENGVEVKLVSGQNRDSRDTLIAVAQSGAARNVGSHDRRRNTIAGIVGCKLTSG